METTIVNKLLILILLCTTGCFTSQDSKKSNYPLVTKDSSSEIPQGKFTYELYFSEFSGRMPNLSCLVEIQGNNILISQDENTNLPGDKIIYKGNIFKHKSGVWILAHHQDAIYANEIGGCTDVPL